MKLGIAQEKMILNLMKYATTYLITNGIGIFWSNMMNMGIYPINLLICMRYVLQRLSVDTAKKNCPGRGRVIGTERDSRFVTSLI